MVAGRGWQGPPWKRGPHEVVLEGPGSRTETIRREPRRHGASAVFGEPGSSREGGGLTSSRDFGAGAPVFSAQRRGRRAWGTEVALVAPSASAPGRPRDPSLLFPSPCSLGPGDLSKEQSQPCPPLAGPSPSLPGSMRLNPGAQPRPQDLVPSPASGGGKRPRSLLLTESGLHASLCPVPVTDGLRRTGGKTGEPQGTRRGIL